MGEDVITTPTGEVTRFLATTATADNRVFVSESFLPAGASAPMHYHRHDEESFYVLSGDMEFDIVANPESKDPPPTGPVQTIKAGRGTFVTAAPFVPRAFRAITDSKVLIVNAPGGPAEAFLRDIASLDHEPNDDDAQRFAKEYGIHILQ
mmetsp:Transcript_6154/g.15194  ORF Transcript_6154/g.15194 Transcript_6154/m.15194 type:complete len:150 (-) Transcript_6154:39-488(-)